MRRNMVFVDFYQNCVDQLVLPQDYTLEKEVKLGTVDYLDFTGVSNGDCLYHIEEVFV